MKARIFKKTKTPTQSGNATSNGWRIEFMPSNHNNIDPIMGWNSSSDTKKQIKLSFDSLEEAENYAKKHHLSYDIIREKTEINKPKSYTDNFK